MIVVFLFDWFKPTHCDKCERASKESRWWGLVGRTWSPDERENLRKAADLMADEEN